MSNKEVIQEEKGLGFFEKYLTIWVAQPVGICQCINTGGGTNLDDDLSHDVKD